MQGREEWNAWAEKMLTERKALKNMKRWAVKENSVGLLEPGTDETRIWMKEAAADFSSCRFLVWEAKGANETAEEQRKGGEEGGLPAKEVRLKALNIDFDGFIFPGAAIFRGAALSAATQFGHATFHGDASFDSATFSGRAQFDSATFSGAARFERATFLSRASFNGAIFHANTRFRSASFMGYSSFNGAAFHGNTRFESVIFQSFASYQEAKFLKDALFKGVKVERAFDLTRAAFAQAPAFNQADFKQAPDLDDVHFPLPGFWRAGEAKLVAQYRALRRMAIQGADYEREQMAYKGELRARRWTVDKWWSIGTWIGLFYDAFADCGRSIVRPANAWLASILLFAAFYWQRAAAGVEARCEEAGGAAVQALFLSVKNALVIFGGTRDARVNQAYLCLYNGSAEQPHIPPTVTFVETLAQIPVSATLIFLFLLAVKNRFKIK